MSPMLRASLPYTLALAFLSFVVFTFLITLPLSAGWAFVAGVLSCGILVPILVDVKGPALPAEQADTANVAADTSFTGETTTLYVGNLPYRANEETVKALFAKYGTVANVRLMKDRQTGRRRGFGFVEVAAADAGKMISKLNDVEFQERTLKVREARERQDDDGSAAE